MTDRPPHWLIRVTTSFACFGFEVEHGIVTRVAPITGWARGRPGKEVVNYWRKRGATVEWWPINGEGP